MILQAQLWHRCMDIIMEKLKHAANVGEFMTDPFGDIQFCFTPLIAWTANLLEQQLISVTQNASPVTLATLEKVGDLTHQPPCTKHHTLDLIHTISGDTEPWLLDHYQKLAKVNHLLGVHLPFFQNWKNSHPFCFLVPKVLHFLHKFFWNHILQWCKEVIGTDKLDAHYKVHHKCVSVHHFASGISHTTQMTGHEYRDIQHNIVAMIAGVAPPAMVQSIHTLLNFIYLIDEVQLQRDHHPKHSAQQPVTLHGVYEKYSKMEGLVVGQQ
ncbi:hypothetical protein EDD15DRAFT_2166857 [Pisolithus albus]|nr:hypothetical protein EDD15DRAFT_2166857 [Pisolithus albus]